MSKQLSLKVALILFLSAGPSIACDPEEMINALRDQCREAIASAAGLIEPLKPQLTSSERSSIEGKIKEGTALCNADKYTDGWRKRASSRYCRHAFAQALLRFAAWQADDGLWPNRDYRMRRGIKQADKLSTKRTSSNCTN